MKAALVVLWALSGCASVNAYVCAESSQCTFQGAAGVCEPNGACSFPDSSCASGRRYGEFSGELGDVCVGAEGVTDDDRDGVDDGRDNCKGVANATQHDEDQDGRGDVCDPCPAFADGATPDDADGDGVSGKCDPEPGVANQIIAFAGFEGPPPPAFTTNGSGTWAYAGDDARASASGTVAMLLITSPGPQAAVMTDLTIEDLDASGTRLAGVIDLFDVDANRGTSCVGIRDSAGNQRLLLSDTMTSQDFGDAPMTVQDGTTAQITSTRDGVSITCANDTASFAGAAAFNPPAPKLGLRTRNAVVKFHWVLIVGRS